MFFRVLLKQGKNLLWANEEKNHRSGWLTSTKTQVWTRRKNLKVWGRVLVVTTVKWQEEYTEKILRRHNTLNGKKTNVRQGAHIHQPTAWPVPCACAQPYHPGSGSNGQLVFPYWGLPAWHSHGTSEILYYRQLHTTHMRAVGWEPHGSSTTACVGKADHELPWSVCSASKFNKKTLKQGAHIQLSMAATARVIWLCACVRYCPGRGLVYVCSLILSLS